MLTKSVRRDWAERNGFCDVLKPTRLRNDILMCRVGRKPLSESRPTHSLKPGAGRRDAPCEKCLVRKAVNLPLTNHRRLGATSISDLRWFKLKLSRSFASGCVMGPPMSSKWLEFACHKIQIMIESNRNLIWFDFAHHPFEPFLFPGPLVGLAENRRKYVLWLRVYENNGQKVQTSRQTIFK